MNPEFRAELAEQAFAELSVSAPAMCYSRLLNNLLLSSA